jgi:hypothetical protein
VFLYTPTQVMRIKGNAEIQVEALKKAEMPLVGHALQNLLHR